MKSFPVFEAKNRFSELIGLVESGQEIAITRRGTPVARLVSVAASSSVDKSADASEILRKLKELCGTLDVQGDLKTIARDGLD